MNDARSRLIVALDVPDRTAALASVRSLSGHVGCFKVGLELFVREGPQLVEEILGLGERVFLDLKLHDIPNTVAGAVRSACRLGVHMLTIHASGGSEMLQAARAAAESAPERPLLLAVTALTSISQPEAQQIGIGTSLAEWVERLAETSLESGIPGLVASSLEVVALRRRFGTKPRLVIPGIRPSGAATQDQARTGTPSSSIRAGADFLVVGRPILQDPNPPEAADRIVAEMADAYKLL
jgi:orotidine-5'-phosphate decarboxylase